MSKFHSTISRRDFLKILGLGGAGLGATAISTPVFHDLDEVLASPEAEFKRSWYVREVDKPTVEINWDIMQRFDYFEVMWANGLRKALGPDQYELVFRIGAQNRIKWLKENRPGFTLRDIALNNANHWAGLSFVGPQTSITPEALGVPPWEGTPEENARMIRAFLRLHGASQVVFAELESNTTEKLIYSYDTGPAPLARGPALVFTDSDNPAEDENTRTIPRKARWVIIYAMRMADELMKRPLNQIGGRSHGYMYNLKSLLQGQLQNFLRTLGYMCLGEATRYNALGVHAGFAVLGGLGEMSRMGHTITPEYGLRQRVQMVITDLPLAPGKPVDFGVMNFCRTCKKCAENCPPKAISFTTEPDWDTFDKPFHNPGIKAWHWPQDKCNAWIRQTGGCAVCFGVCPLSKGNRNAIYHDFMKATLSKTPVFNRLFKNFDDFMDYGIKNPETFWELDLPPWGYD